MVNTDLHTKNQPHRSRDSEHSKSSRINKNASGKIKKRQLQRQDELIEWVEIYKPKCLVLIQPLREKFSKGTITASDCIRVLAVDAWYCNKFEKLLKNCGEFKFPINSEKLLNENIKVKFLNFLLSSSKEFSSKKLIENKINDELANIEQELV